jgi:hypothetical protein
MVVMIVIMVPLDAPVMVIIVVMMAIMLLIPFGGDGGAGGGTDRTADDGPFTPAHLIANRRADRTAHGATDGGIRGRSRQRRHRQRQQTTDQHPIDEFHAKLLSKRETVINRIQI